MIGGFRSVFFVAEKPLPMTRTCTAVNFHNFHGQLGSLVFEQTESSDKCWFVVKWLFQRDPKGKLKIPRRRKDQLVVSNQVVAYPCCDLSVIFCGFISHLIGRETINIPEVYSGVHGFYGKDCKKFLCNLRVFARKLASPFGHRTQVSMQVELAFTYDYLPVLFINR